MHNEKEMKISEKPLQLILKKDFAEAIKAGVKPYEFRTLGSNLGAKLFKGGIDWDNFVKYPSIRFQIGYSKKYLLVELVNTCFVTLKMIEQTNPALPERAIWDEDAQEHPEKYTDEPTLRDALQGYADVMLEEYTDAEKEDIFVVIFKLGKILEDCSGL